LAEESLGEDWPRNYFNYFTEIEERFREARGTGLFLLSPLDWALIETWKDTAVPLEAVLNGIDRAFETWRSRKRRTQSVNSLAYCAQQVMKAAEDLARGGSTAPREAAPPFTVDELREYLTSNAVHLKRHPDLVYFDIGEALAELSAHAEEHYADLEALEQQLTVFEETMLATARIQRSGEELLNARRELDSHLRPYRGKMTADQLSMLERQFLDRRLLEQAGLRRLSLFYMGS